MNDNPKNFSSLYVLSKQKNKKKTAGKAKKLNFILILKRQYLTG